MLENTLIPRKTIKRCTQLSVVLALVLAFTSLAGILRQGMLYPSETDRTAFLPNDVINLALGVPALLVLMGLAGRSRPIAQLLWPGAVLFVSYNALAYCVALTRSPLFGLYLLELVLSLVFFFYLVRAVDAQAVAARAGGKAFEKLAGWVLLGLGLLILFRNIGVVVGTGALTGAEMGVMAADLLSVMVWMGAGIYLLGRKITGYRMGPAALFQASLLFFSLIVVMAIQPLFGAAAFGAVDFVVVFLMSLVCWVPFILQLRSLQRVLDRKDRE
jgi:hypothetical protein